MAKTVFEDIKILFPRLDQNHYETTADILKSFKTEHPEFENLTYDITLSVFEDKTACLRIAVIDPAQPSARENFNLVGTIVIVMLFLAIVLYA